MQTVLRSGVRVQQTPGSATVYRFPRDLVPEPPVIDPGSPSIARGVAALLLMMGWSLRDFARWTEERFATGPLTATYRRGEDVLTALADEHEALVSATTMKGEKKEGRAGHVPHPLPRSTPKDRVPPAPTQSEISDVG